MVKKDLDLAVILGVKLSYNNADFDIIAAPTNCDLNKQYSVAIAIVDVINLIMECELDVIMILMPMVSVGYTQSI